MAIAHSTLKVIWSVLKHDRPFVEPDVLVVRTLEREKQIRHHSQRLRQLGADEQTIAALMKTLLEAPQPSSADQPPPAKEARPGDSAGALRPKYSPQGSPPARRRPLARGVLGFRIRTAEKKQYAVVNELLGSPHKSTPPETTKARKSLGNKTKARSPARG